ncbi:hypothetical protein GGS21DRAFT_176877 [Xylaria nigripes]|nr:hypothetical protein GGS21DRAFT_176877 [Xylaria nigripes]
MFEYVHAGIKARLQMGRGSEELETFKNKKVRRQAGARGDVGGVFFTIINGILPCFHAQDGCQFGTYSACNTYSAYDLYFALACFPSYFFRRMPTRWTT